MVINENWSLDAYTDWLLPPLFALVFGGIIAVLMSPLAYYSGFVLPHRYGMSNQILKDWIIDRIKGMLVAAPIGLIVLEVIYVFLRAFPETWWLWVAGFLLVFNRVYSE